jgi:tetratricopeptide (TPR) repeat protein
MSIQVKASLEIEERDIKTLLQETRSQIGKGKMDDAKKIIRHILAIEPNNSTALFYLGYISAEDSQYTAAIELLSQSIAIDSSIAKRNFYLGNLLLKMDRAHESIRYFQKAISLDSTFVEAYNNMAVASKRIGALKKAEELFYSAISINPNYADAHYNLGNTLLDLEGHQRASDCYDKAIQLGFSAPEIYNNRGLAKFHLKKYDEAIDSCNVAISMRPDYAEAYNNSGMILSAMGRVDEALTKFNKAIEIKGDYADALSNRGVALKSKKRISEAIDSFNLALEINKNKPDILWNKSITMLTSGRFTEGWKLYESRWQLKGFPSPNRQFAQPLWLGNFDIAGKTILLHAEQGFGDTIQFARYCKDVKKLGAKVILEISERLIELFKCLEGVDQLIANGTDLPCFDCHCPLLSLPLAFQTEVDSIPCTSPYLRIPEKLINFWPNLLGTKSRPRIGLAWSGSRVNTMDGFRSIPLGSLVRALPKEYDYFCLQNDIREQDKAVLDDSDIHYFPDSLDFLHTAALAAEMDLVISVDTSIAHLCGSLGCRTWVLLAYAADWRWLLDRTDSPWYPTVRLFRQAKVNEWESVVADLRGELLRLPLQ